MTRATAGQKHLRKKKPETSAQPRRIADYGFIGNCESGALVHRTASIEWLCWPRFDSEACLASLLGSPENGFWKISPATAKATYSRRYRGESLILETTIETERGSATVIDFMPVQGSACALVRVVEGRKGVLRLKSDLQVAFAYGRVAGRWRKRSDRELVAMVGPNALRLTSDVRLRGNDYGQCCTEFSVRPGQQIGFVLDYFESYGREPVRVSAAAALKRTEQFWRTWIGKCSYEGPWRDAVIRSLLTIKGLSYRPSGGIAAAATGSLPEKLGGDRNWDYRACWLRDSTFTLLAFLSSGYRAEARAWRDWLVRTVGGEPIRVRPLYGLGGESRMPEWEAQWLRGFGGAHPVRFGNAASEQLQLDVYGEVIEALEQAHRHGIAIDETAWRIQVSLVEFLERHWRQHDRGIWESRGRAKRFTHSQVMVWTALDRMIRWAEAEKRSAPLARWKRLRGIVHAEICRRGFNRKLGSFVRDFDSTNLDASLLRLAQVGFLRPDDPRIHGTVDAIGRYLLRDGLVYRHRSGGTRSAWLADEPAILVCSLWYADALVLLRRKREAIETLERVLALRNDLGLLAEAFDPDAGELSGNFPQTLSHLAVVNTALNLEGRRGPAWRWTGTPKPR